MALEAGVASVWARIEVARLCGADAGRGDGVAITVTAGAIDTNGEGVGAGPADVCGSGVTTAALPDVCATASVAAAGVGSEAAPPPDAAPAPPELDGAPGAPKGAG